MQITKSIHRTLLAGTLVAASAAIALADFPNRNIEIFHPCLLYTSPSPRD